MTGSSPTLYVVRHGRTPWNAEGRLQGQHDIPLDDMGRDQARGNGCLLAGLLGRADGFAFVTSPLRRARQTMERIRAEMGLEPAGYRCDERLKEVSFGDWEGCTASMLNRDYPELQAARVADSWSFTPPGGESYAAMSRRIDDWLGSCAQDAVIVAHGGVLRILQVLVSGAPRDHATGLPAPQDQVMRIRNGRICWLRDTG